MAYYSIYGLQALPDSVFNWVDTVQTGLDPLYLKRRLMHREGQIVV